MIELNKIILADCMDIMKTIPDKYFELAIVDPPYGIGYEDGGQYFLHKGKNKKWDVVPDENYFKELSRISKNQIIWGMNYFNLPPCRGFICWYKSDEIKDRTFSECELAWTSFELPARHYELKPFLREGIETRFHPTQKPVALYKWLLKNYAKQGDKIIDTHSGSGTLAIACIDRGFEYLCIEKDKEYFEKSVERVKKELIKINLFN